MKKQSINEWLDVFFPPYADRFLIDVKTYKELIQERMAIERAEAELAGLSLIENAPRVPVELMSMVQIRKKEILDKYVPNM